MDRPFNVRINELRKKSRTLIRHLGETSKRINNEACQTQSQSLLRDCPAKSKSYKYWKMRNNSCSVDRLLCPDYFQSGVNCAGKAATGKIVISSKAPSVPKFPRKPVKGCYCYANTKKFQCKKSADQLCFPCARCKSKFDIVEIESSTNTTTIPNRLTDDLPPLSGETLQKVGKIAYSPTSEFLRRVQKKVSSQKKKKSVDDSCTFATSRSSSSRRQCSERITRDSGRGESAAEIRCCEGKNTTTKTRQVRSRSETRKINEIWPRVDERRRSFTTCQENQGRKTERRVTMTRRSSTARSSGVYNNHGIMSSDDRKTTSKDQELMTKPSRGSFKKLIRSVNRQTDEQLKNERESAKHAAKTKRIVPTITAHNRCCTHENIPSVIMESRRRRRRIGEKSQARYDCGIRECSANGHRATTWQLSRVPRDSIYVGQGDCDDKIRDLNKFRRDNYFETHGSTQSLLVGSSTSSGSLEQYELNERLFPEPIRKIHRDNIVVTMPRCATKQRKRIHYFPRNLVNQEKSVSNTNYRKKRRSQSCGLTGHAIDLGVFKVPRDVSNSFALKYQKGVTAND